MHNNMEKDRCCFALPLYSLSKLFETSSDPGSGSWREIEEKYMQCV